MKQLAIFFTILALFLLSACENKAQFDITRPAVAAGSPRFDIQPGGGTANSVWVQQPKISIVDENDQVITSGPDSVALVMLNLSSGSGTLSGTTMAFAIAGEIVYSDLKINTLGSKTITATKYGTPTSSATSNAFNITAGAPSKIELSSLSSALDPGVCHPIAINLMDAGNNIVNALSNISISFSGLQNSTLYTNSTCSTDLTSLTLPVGQSTLTFYLRDEGQESLRISAIPHDHLISQDTLSLEINPLRFSKTFMAAGGNTLCGLTTVGTIFCGLQNASSSSGQTGYLESEPRKILRFDSPIVDFDVSDNAACVLLSNGQVRCWGSAAVGIRGNGTSSNTINTSPSTVILPGAASQLMFVNSRSACALVNVSSVNKVYCWGENTSRNLGDLTTTVRTTPVEAQLGLVAGQTITKIRRSIARDRDMAYAILNDGTVKVWGYLRDPETLTDINGVDIEDVRDIARARDYNCVIQIDRTVSCWGANNYGQLGNGTQVSNYVPVPVNGVSDAEELYLTDSSVIVKRTNGTYYQWGSVWGFESFTAQLVTLPDEKFSSYSDAFCGVSIANNSEINCTSTLITPYLQEVPSFQKINATSSVTIIQRNSDCSQIDTEIYNQRSVRPTTNNLVLTPTDLSNFGSFFYDSSCSNPLTSYTIPSGDSKATFYYQSNYSGTRANSSKIKITTDNVATKAALLSVQHKGIPHTVSASFAFGSTCNPYILTVRDNNSNEVRLTSSLNVSLSLSADPSIVRIYSDPSCTTEIYNFTISAGQSRTTYYTRGQSCSNSNLTVNYTGLPTSSSAFSYYDDCGCD